MTDRNYTCVASAMQSSKNIIINIGDVFITNQGSKIRVLEYVKNSKILIEFLDEFNYKKYVAKVSILNGRIKNPYHPNVVGVGYTGVGEFKETHHIYGRTIYGTWQNMLYRCYSSNIHKKYATYRDCEVCDEWHNFQNFAS